MIFPQSNNGQQYAIAPGPSNMTAVQVQDYIDLLCSKVATLGELYVARQLAWATAELERVQ
ncbi:hypothetical protein ACEN88_12920 [Massilia sp. CT11-108]|uniref:hypothetical protein n=1 Tax=Massilia sp. CT11-108 TaxID=3393900 RepID=UPI0039A56275